MKIELRIAGRERLAARLAEVLARIKAAAAAKNEEGRR